MPSEKARRLLKLPGTVVELPAVVLKLFSVVAKLPHDVAPKVA
jgi:hypothetical protein